MEKLGWDFAYTKKRAQDGIVHQDCERGSQLELLLWGCRFCMASSELLVPTQALLVSVDAQKLPGSSSPGQLPPSLPSSETPNAAPAQGSRAA